MYATQYIRVKTLDEAVTKLKQADDGKLLAGGMTLIPTLKQRLAAPDCLIDLANIGLSGIDNVGDRLHIGAMSYHAEIEKSAIVKATIPALSILAGGIGDRQVRDCGTIGGSVANNDPAACWPPAILALEATIHTSKRDISAADYFTGLFETTLDSDEIITAISFPKPKISAYEKFPNPASRYAMVGVFIAVTVDGVRVAITGAGADGVFRHNELEAALDKNFIPSAVNSVNITSENLMSDIHADADYRAHLISEMARRAVAACKS